MQPVETTHSIGGNTVDVFCIVRLSAAYTKFFLPYGLYLKVWNGGTQLTGVSLICLNAWPV